MEKRSVLAVFALLAVVHGAVVEEEASISVAGNVKCLMEPDPGRCRAMNIRWYWNAGLGRCMDFVYGGCGGNHNNFDSEAKCMNVCHVGETETVAPTSTDTVEPVTTTAPAAAAEGESTTPTETSTQAPTTAVTKAPATIPDLESGWGPWKKWRHCYPLAPDKGGADCGPLSGMQKRKRPCLIKGKCKGMRSLRLQLRPCKFRKCAAVYEFSKWSQCSATCGAGSQSRTRSCSSSSPASAVCGGPAMETRPCKITSCRRATLCDRKPCKNGGTCIRVGRGFQCSCAGTFHGPICQWK